MFPYVSAAYQEAAFRGASQALRCVSRRPPKGAVEERISRSRLRSFNRCAARLAPRAERSAWSWTSTLEIRPDLENDEIADWRRRGHRDAAPACALTPDKRRPAQCEGDPSHASANAVRATRCSVALDRHRRVPIAPAARIAE